MISLRARQLIAAVFASAALSVPTLADGLPSSGDSGLPPGVVPVDEEVTVAGEADFTSDSLTQLEMMGLVLRPGSAGTTLKLCRGRLLLCCSNAIRVRLPDATVEIGANSIVYIYSTGATCEVLNLYDKHARSVLVSLDKRTIEVAPGRELLLTRERQLGFAEARLFPAIWYRTVYKLQVSEDVAVYETQFSALSAIFTLPAVFRLVDKESPYQNRVLKMAAAVFATSHDPVPFHPMSDGQPNLPQLARSPQ